MYVGDIYVQATSNLSSKTGKRQVDEINGLNMNSSIAPPKSKKINDIKITGSVYTENGKTEDEYAEDLLAINNRTGAYNYIKYADTDGFLESENISIPKDADVWNLRDFSIDGKFLPSAKYERTYILNTTSSYDTDIINPIVDGMPAIVALPIGARNVKIKSPYQTLSIPTPTFTMQSFHGTMPLYMPFPIMNVIGTPEYAFRLSSGCSVDFDSKYYEMNAVKIGYFSDGAMTGVNWFTKVGIDIPRGQYKLAIKIRYDGEYVSSSDVDNLCTLWVYGHDDSNHQVRNIVYGAPISLSANWQMVILDDTYLIDVSDLDETLEIQFIRSGKMRSDINIYIEYIYLIPAYQARISYEVDQDYDVGEVKIFDVVNGIYKRVYSEDHKFEGTIYVCNAFTGWFIDPTKLWIETGILIDSTNQDIDDLRFYPEAFSNTYPDITISSILPDEIKFTIQCARGRPETNAQNARMITDVSVLPYMINFNVHKINPFIYDWFMQGVEIYSDFNYYGNNIAIKTSDSVDTVVATGNVGFCYFKYGTSLFQISKNNTNEFRVWNNGSVMINGLTNNDNDYKFSLSSIPLNTQKTCYAGNVFCISEYAGGLSGKSFVLNDVIGRKQVVGQWFKSIGYGSNINDVATYIDKKLTLNMTENSVVMLQIKNQRYDQFNMSFKIKFS